MKEMTRSLANEKNERDEAHDKIKGSTFHNAVGKPADDLGKEGDVYADHETVFDGLWLKRQDGWAFIVAPLFPEMRYTKRLCEAEIEPAGPESTR